MPSPRRRRQDDGAATPFAQAAQDDAQLRDGAEESSNKSKNMTFMGRFMVFFVFPLSTGICGLIIGYIQTKRDDERKLDFDIDFIFPFLCSLSIGVVVAIQTKGFTTAPAPFLVWPKVRRKRKILRKRIVVPDPDEGEEHVDEEDDEPMPDKKND